MLSACIWVVGAAVYACFVTADIQWWNEPGAKRDADINRSAKEAEAEASRAAAAAAAAEAEPRKAAEAEAA